MGDQEDGGGGENPDIRGYMYNNVGRGLLFISQLFLFTAMLAYANEAAGCSSSGETCAEEISGGFGVWNSTNSTTTRGSTQTATDGDETCGRVWGLKPAALIAQVMTLGALVSAVLMPVAGSIVDHTPYRRELGMASLGVAWVCTTAQLSIGKETWQFLLLLQGSLCMAAYLFNVVCAMAYMAELTTDLTGEMIRINAKARVLEMCAMLAFMTGQHKGAKFSTFKAPYLRAQFPTQFQSSFLDE